MPSFGSQLRHYRLRAGLGLRTFAALMEERASTVSAIESGHRAPWRRETTLARAAEVLGLPENTEVWQAMLAAAQSDHTEPASPAGNLLWWWTTEDAPALDGETLLQLAQFVGAEFDLEETPQDRSESSKPLTELAIEWRVRQLLGRRSTQFTSAPVDVEAVLESESGVRLEIVPGLIPRFSVQACLLRSAEQTTIVVDRIMADSRPASSYRYLLAQCYAPAALWDFGKELPNADWFWELQKGTDWPLLGRDCRRFALAMLLPASPLLAGAQSAYRELVEQQGWVELEQATLTVRNRLAEQFSVPPTLVHRRLMGWPCHLYGRIAQALAAEELTLPPADWFDDQEQPRQRLLFETQVSRSSSARE